MTNLLELDQVALQEVSGLLKGAASHVVALELRPMCQVCLNGSLQRHERHEGTWLGLVSLAWLAWLGLAGWPGLAGLAWLRLSLAGLAGLA